MHQKNAQIKEFVNAHNIPPEVAKDYIHHNWHLHVMKAMRAKDKGENREEKKKRQYDEYSWEEVYITGGLDKLLVEDLNKYFGHHNRTKAHKLKREKLQIITFHLHKETQKK